MIRDLLYLENRLADGSLCTYGEGYLIGSGQLLFSRELDRQFRDEWRRRQTAAREHCASLVDEATKQSVRRTDAVSDQSLGRIEGVAAKSAQPFDQSNDAHNVFITSDNDALETVSYWFQPGPRVKTGIENLVLWKAFGIQTK